MRSYVWPGTGLLKKCTLPNYTLDGYRASMFGIGFEKLLTLAILAAVLIGPDKLPQFAVEAARFLQKIRQMSRDAMAEFKSELGPEFANLDIADLNPKTFIANHLDDIAADTKNIVKGAALDLEKAKEQARIDPDLL